MGDITPFKGERLTAAPPMRVLHRFTKNGHVVEVRERKVTHFRALEFIVFFDGQLQESQLFHHGRELEYPAALAACVAQYVDGGWKQEPVGRFGALAPSKVRFG
jgi:hypothetical protein